MPNLHKADWDSFRSQLECLVSAKAGNLLNSSVEELEEFLRKAVKKAAKSSIPHGRHHEETPCLPITVRKMIEERDLISNQAQI